VLQDIREREEKEGARKAKGLPGGDSTTEG
jgi:hypothetical protein